MSELQRRLNARGATLRVDGIFGPNTLQTVQEFQRRNRLIIDGIVGESTWLALGGAPTGATALETPQSTPTALEGLRLIARDGSYLVFDRAAFRSDVVRYLWGGSLNPTRAELYARSGQVRTSDGHDLDLGDTHWALARTAFAARPHLYSSMRPQVLHQLERLHDRATGRPAPAPHWMSRDAWNQALLVGDGIHRYQRASSLGTDVIVVRRSGQVYGAYAETPTNEAQIRRHLNLQEPSTLRRVLGFERPEQANVRWLAEANRGYNRFMLQSMRSGRGPREALRNYRNAVHQRYIRAFIPLIGGSFAAHPAGGTIMGAWRAATD